MFSDIFKAYNPRQPRYPKGHPQGGQWRSKISGRLLERAPARLRARLSDIVTVRSGLFTRQETAAVNSTVRIISGLHKVSGLPRLSIRTQQNPAAPFYGAYWPGRRHIDITSAGSHPHMTTAHEIGHFFDHQNFGGEKWGSMSNPKYAGWRKAVENSQAIKTMRQAEKDGYLRVGKLKLGFNRNTSRYYLHPREIWARSYAQYVARRTGHRSLLRELRMLQRSTIPTQWRDDDFEPIAREIEKLLRSQGWL